MSNQDEIAIKVSHVSKSFKLPHEKNTSVKSIVVNPFKKRTFEKQEVLKGIDFEVKKGEFFGIVGRNGSGKSTLLKLLAGIYSPDSGHIQVNGKLTPFIELGVGFNFELTGRENVFLNGALLGFNRKEMTAMYDEIVEFAELEKFMDLKLKNYSSGMQVRLAFSIAIRANSGILLLDEVLAVGDEAFQRKCYEYFAELKRTKKTVILVTHDMDSVSRFCNRAMLINEGRIKLIGNPGEVADSYKTLNLPKEQNSRSQEPGAMSDYGIITLGIGVGSKKQHAVLTSSSEKINIDINVQVEQNIKKAFLGLTLKKTTGEFVYWFTSENKTELSKLKNLTKGQTITLQLEIQNIFGEGDYIIGTYIKSIDRTRDFIYVADAARITIAGFGKNGWTLRPHESFKLK